MRSMNAALAMEKPSAELVVVDVLKAEVVFAPGGVEKIIAEIKTKVAAFTPDISTDAGREAVASMAYKVARSKTALDELGKNFVADLKKKTGAIDADRRRIRDELDALKESVRKPLTDWESAEQARVDGHLELVAQIRELPNLGNDPSPEEIRTRIAKLGPLLGRDWQEFSRLAADTITAVTKSLASALDLATQRETERAELEQLRQEKAKREQKEREEKIAADAAEKARKAAEEAIAVAKADAAKAEEALRASEARAKADAEEAARKAEADRIAAEEKAKRDRDAAVEAERKRVADAQEAEAKEKARREANKKHRAKINNEIVDGLVAAGLLREQAVVAVVAIAKGDVRHVTISY